MACRLLFRACRQVAFTSRLLSGDSRQAAFASRLLSGASPQGFLGAARGVAEFSTGKKFGKLKELSEDEGSEKQTGRQQASGGTGTDSDTPDPFSSLRKGLEVMLEAQKEKEAKAKEHSKIIWFDELSDSFALHEKRLSEDQQKPIVSKPSVVKKPSALSDIMNELKRVAKPYPNLAIPREYHKREYLGQAVPMFEGVSTRSSFNSGLQVHWINKKIISTTEYR